MFKYLNYLFILNWRAKVSKYVHIFKERKLLLHADHFEICFDEEEIVGTYLVGLCRFRIKLETSCISSISNLILRKNWYAYFGIGKDLLCNTFTILRNASHWILIGEFQINVDSFFFKMPYINQFSWY